MSESKNWITSDTMNAAAALLEDLETFMTTEIAVPIPPETPIKVLRVLEKSGAIRSFRMNTGFGVNDYFAIAVR